MACHVVCAVHQLKFMTEEKERLSAHMTTLEQQFLSDKHTLQQQVCLAPFTALSHQQPGRWFAALAFACVNTPCACHGPCVLCCCVSEVCRRLKRMRNYGPLTASVRN